MAALRLGPMPAMVLLLALAALDPAHALGMEVLDAEETAAMLALRDALYRTAAPWVSPIPGWSRHNPNPHCTWAHVKCEERTGPSGLAAPTRRVTQIRLWSPERLTPEQRARVNASRFLDGWLAPQVPLLPELATKLPYLEHLAIGQFYAPFAGLPPEWLAPGAFPRLKTLELAGIGLGSGLPELQPGRLPALERLHLEFDEGGPCALPPSWGSSPEVLPSLQALHVAMPLSPQLPHEWGLGFWQLRQLGLLSPACGRRLAAAEAAAPAPGTPAAAAGGGRASSTAAHSGRGSKLGVDPRPAPAVPAGGPSSVRLPVTWAAGFPALRELTLCGLGLGGTLPPAWLQHSAFPLLSSLNLAGNRLTGALPDQLFVAHKLLTSLDLGANGFAGPLPDAWAPSKVQALFLANNSLSGPAFPPAWLAPGAMPALADLSLSGNPGLGGELPPQLPWLNLNSLRLVGTGVRGAIPQDWCLGPLKLSLRHMWIRGTAIVPTLPECASRGVGRLYLDVPMHAASGTASSGTAGTAASAGGQLPEDALPGGGVAPGSLPPGVLARSRQGQAEGGGTGVVIVAGAAAALAASAVLAAGVAGRTLWSRHQHRLLSKHGRLGGGGKGGAGGGGGGSGGGDEEQARHLLLDPAEPSSSAAPQGSVQPAEQLSGERGKQAGVAALLAASVQSAGIAAGAAAAGQRAGGSSDSSTASGSGLAVGSSQASDDDGIELTPWEAVPRDLTRSQESLRRRQEEEQRRQQLEASLLRQWQQLQDAQARQQQQELEAQQQEQQVEAQAAQRERKSEAQVVQQRQAGVEAARWEEQLRLGAGVAEQQRRHQVQQVQQEAARKQQQHQQQGAAPRQQQPPAAPQRHHLLPEQAQSQPPTPQLSETAAQLQAQLAQHRPWPPQQPPQQTLQPLPPQPRPPPAPQQQQQQQVMQALQAQLLRAMQQPQQLPAEHQLLLQAIQQKLLLLTQQGHHLPAAQQQQMRAIQLQLLILAQRQQQSQRPASQQQPAAQAQRAEAAASLPAQQAADLLAGGLQPTGLSGGSGLAPLGPQHGSSSQGSTESSMQGGIGLEGGGPQLVQPPAGLGGTSAWPSNPFAAAAAASSAVAAPVAAAAAAAGQEADEEDEEEDSLLDDEEYEFSDDDTEEEGQEEAAELAEEGSLLDDEGWSDGDEEWSDDDDEAEEAAAALAAPAAPAALAQAGAVTPGMPAMAAMDHSSQVDLGCMPSHNQADWGAAFARRPTAMLPASCQRQQPF